MPKLIKNGEVVANSWQKLTHKEECDAADLSTGYWVLPLDVYLELKSSDRVVTDNCGVWVFGDTKPTALAPVLQKLPLICIDFPVFTDGRGFSLARILREHHDYEGDLRACGGFIQDQLFYLLRCGFSSFIIDDSADIASIQQSLSDFSITYQAAVDEPQPLFRRRI